MENCHELWKALLKAQSELPAAKREARNEFKKYSYADINSVLEVVRPILNKHGIVVTQSVFSSACPECYPVVTTTLTHAESGSSWSAPMTIPCDARDIQKLGAAVTYGRRYSLVSMLCLEQEDPDADDQVQRQQMANKAPSVAKTCLLYRPMEHSDKLRLAEMMRQAKIEAKDMLAFSEKVAGKSWDEITTLLKGIGQ